MTCSKTELRDLKDEYLGKSCWLVCGGPSVRGFDFSRLKGTVAAINEIGRDIPNLDIWIGNDNLPDFPPEFWARDCLKFVGRHQHTLPRCEAKNLVRFNSAIHSRTDQRPYLRVEEFFHGEKVVIGAPVQNNGGTAQKKSAMLMAFGVLYRLGFREVKLLGCDWSSTLTDAYGHDHKEVDETAIRKSNEQFRFMEQWYSLLLPYFKALGFKVYNCTDGGELEIFERRDWRAFARKESPLPVSS